MFRLLPLASVAVALGWIGASAPAVSHPPDKAPCARISSESWRCTFTGDEEFFVDAPALRAECVVHPGTEDDDDRPYITCGDRRPVCRRGELGGASTVLTRHTVYVRRPARCVVDQAAALGYRVTREPRDNVKWRR